MAELRYGRLHDLLTAIEKWCAGSGPVQINSQELDKIKVERMRNIPITIRRDAFYLLNESQRVIDIFRVWVKCMRIKTELYTLKGVSPSECLSDAMSMICRIKLCSNLNIVKSEAHPASSIDSARGAHVSLDTFIMSLICCRERKRRSLCSTYCPISRKVGSASRKLVGFRYISPRQIVVILRNIS